jgi:hypothetical protein
MSEQQTAIEIKCPHPEVVGMRWGDPISAERQATLQDTLDRWEADTRHSTRTGPFAGTRLNGADVFWLATRARLAALATNDATPEEQTRNAFDTAREPILGAVTFHLKIT